MMAHLMLNHEAIDTAAQEMNQAAQAMQQTFDEMMQQISALAESFQGAAAEVFQEMSRRQGLISQELGASFGSGATALNNMHDEINTADNNGAKILGR
jgi:uncharacterized protein YukE